MITSHWGWLLQWASRAFPRGPERPRSFTNTNFMKVPRDIKIEEEKLDEDLLELFYPVRIGEVFAGRYQVVGKLGFGMTSTVWLGRDLSERRYVTLKVFLRTESIIESHVDRELNMYKRMGEVAESSSHPGRFAVRTLLDSFVVKGPDGSHQVLVHPPLWSTVGDFIHNMPDARYPKPLLGVILKHLMAALDFLHTECKIIHTDIKADNIMIATEDDTIFRDFEEEELKYPSGRKEVGDRIIYCSRELKGPERLGRPFLCDFGSAVLASEKHTDDVQPNEYKAPEIIMGAPWDYKIDIWNAGCLVWCLYEGGPLFLENGYIDDEDREQLHLAEMIALIGPPPQDVLQRGELARKWFSEDADDVCLPPFASLEERETNHVGEEKQQFLRFMRKMLQWKPEDRRAGRELYKDEWLETCETK